MTVRKRSSGLKKPNTYTIVSIRGYDEYFKGTYLSFKEAMRKARAIDSNLTVSERRNGSRTEVWTNYDESNGTIQTVHGIRRK